MPATIDPRPTIGDAVPGYSRVLLPVVRVETWGPIGAGLQPIDPLDAAADGWSAIPEFTLETPNQRARLAVRVAATGRHVQRWGGDGWLRGRLEICGDGEPSRFLPCWILCGWTS